VSGSRRLREYMLARQRDYKRPGGRRPRWSPAHQEAFIRQAKQAFRGSRELPPEEWRR
jgi:hypothetical protein